MVLYRQTLVVVYTINHGLRGSAIRVLTATGFINGRWQNSTHTESTPIDRSQKNLLLVITSATPTDVPNLAQIRPRGDSGQMVKYKLNESFYLFIYTFLHELAYRSDPSTDFHAWWLKRRGLAQGCAFWGFRWYCSPFWRNVQIFNFRQSYMADRRYL